MRDKPPIGTTPYFVAIPRRIVELSEAIKRFAESDKIGTDKVTTDAVKKWATEIAGHCETMSKIMEEK